MTTEEHAREDAVKAAGNWRRFESFAWEGKPDDADNWAIFNPSHRDSPAIDRANYKAWVKALEPFEDDVSFETHGHWAVGHVNAICVRVYDATGNITPAWVAVTEIRNALSDHPVIDDEILSEVEQEDEDKAWSSWLKYDVRAALKGDDQDLVDEDRAENTWFEAMQNLGVSWEHNNEGPTIPRGDFKEVVREWLRLMKQ